MKPFRVLCACEMSGVVRDAFIAKGHDAWSCDLLPSLRPGPHIQGDVLDVLSEGWDLMIAHPPCVYLCNSGVRWLYTGGRGTVIDPDRWLMMNLAARFFADLQDAPIPRVCIENPVQHRYAAAMTGPYTQIIQPWMFGHGETKATCLWLKNLPKLVPTNVVEGREPRIHHMPPSRDRGMLRSVTLSGIAQAFADQWGSLP